ncbi:GSCOCG00010440001-RA-CDS [Cotesia congregata]|nr:GSCOCG00010440001-RA-CDS [Cotesia congregata]
MKMKMMMRDEWGEVELCDGVDGSAMEAMEVAMSPSVVIEGPVQLAYRVILYFGIFNRNRCCWS